MTNRTIQKNGGYSKKELIEIISKIDAEKSGMDRPVKEKITNRKDNSSYFVGNMKTPQKHTER